MKNPSGINKNLINILFLSIVLSCCKSFSQNDIYFKTFYKNNPTLEFTEERFEFSFLAKEAILILKDLDLNVERKYYVNFYKSSYSKDGKNYLVSYITDMDRHLKYYNDFDEAGMFIILYDKKNGNILGVKIKLGDAENKKLYDIYLTEKGKEVMHFNK